MPTEPNSMSPAWCAARRREAEAWLATVPASTPGHQHVLELLAQLERPPVADWQALADAARAALAAPPYTNPNAPLWRTYRALATPANILALLAKLAEK